jgi:predicted acyltransferase
MQTSSSSSAGRIVSLDVMRGMTMAAMIVVNNPGSWSHVYPPLLHAPWHGCTPTDLVFPFFLFIVGVAMPFSLEKRKLTPSGIWKKIVVRTVLLCLLGFFLGVFPTVLWDPGIILTGRWPGVLQRIGICYAIVSAIALTMNQAGRVACGLGLLVLYLVGMLAIDVPGYGAGIMEPLGNFCWWLDNQLLFGHVWVESPAPGFDPEGVWSTLPAIVTTLLGYEVGCWLRENSSSQEQKLIRLFVWANGCLILAYLLSWVIPINKQLWTPSYVFMTAGLAMHFLALCFWWTDLRGRRLGVRWSLVLGTNAIFAYVLAGMLGDILGLIPIGKLTFKQWLFSSLSAGGLPPQFASLSMAIFFLIVCWSITALLYWRKIFLRL